MVLLFTGSIIITIWGIARIIPIMICPLVKTVVAILFLVERMG